MTTVASRPPMRGASSDTWRSLCAAHGLRRKLVPTIKRIDGIGEY